jgi:hypothetical protein
VTPAEARALGAANARDADIWEHAVGGLRRYVWFFDGRHYFRRCTVQRPLQLGETRVFAGTYSAAHLAAEAGRDLYELLDAGVIKPCDGRLSLPPIDATVIRRPAAPSSPAERATRGP